MRRRTKIIDIERLRQLKKELEKEDQEPQVEAALGNTIEDVLVDLFMRENHHIKEGKIWPGFECSHCGNDLVDELIPPENCDPKNPCHCTRCGKDYFIR